MAVHPSQDPQPVGELWRPEPLINRIDLGKGYGLGELGSVPGQSFDLVERIRGSNPDLPTVISTEDDLGGRRDWWFEDGVLIDVKKLLQEGEEGATMRFGPDMLKNGYPTEVAVGQIIPVPNLSAQGRQRDAANWSAGVVKQFLLVMGSGSSDSSPYEGALQTYDRLVMEKYGVSMREYARAKAKRTRNIIPQAAGAQALGGSNAG